MAAGDAWLQTMQENNTQLTLSSATNGQVFTRDLPRSNFIGMIGFRLTVGGTITAGNNALRVVRIIANGSAVLLDVTGGQLRALQKFFTGRATLAVGGAGNSLYVASIFMGRFPRDETVILPAKVFKSLQIQFTIDSATITSPTLSLDLWTEELVSAEDPRSKLIKKTYRAATVASGANVVIRQRVPLGNLMRRAYISADDATDIGATEAHATTGDSDVRGQNLIQVLINNGSEVPIAWTPNALAEQNAVDYRFADGLIPGAETTSGLSDNFAGAAVAAKMLAIDFDLTGTLEHLIDTSQMNELQIQVQGGANAAAADNVNFILEEILAVG